MENYLVINGIRIELTEEQLNQLKQSTTQSSPTTWKEFGKISGYYINTDSNIVNIEYALPSDRNKNIFPSKEEAEACLALSQLCQWRDKYNEGWKPNYGGGNECRYIIEFYNNKIYLDYTYYTHNILSFKSRETRDKFYENFKDLIEIAKPLL